MYPVEWTADEVRYHVEQAFLDAGREGRLVEGAGRRSRQRWTGMYNGVRTEGEVFAGEIVWFRPSADQNNIDLVRYPRLHPVLRLPVEERPARTPPLLSHRTLDVLTYGDRASRSGAYHRLRGGGLVPGVRVTPLSDPVHANGTYLAEVWFLDPRVRPGSARAELDHHWRLHADGTGQHRMFPDAWTPAELVAAVLEARAVAHVIGAVRDEVDGARTWVGAGRGVRIEAEQDAAGRILAVRPTLDQPAPGEPALGRSTPAAGVPEAPPDVVATGPEVSWFQLGGSGLPVVVVARLLDRGQVNFHVELRMRLVGAEGTDQEALDAFGERLDRLNGSALERSVPPGTRPPVDTSPPGSAYRMIPTPSRSRCTQKVERRMPT